MPEPADVGAPAAAGPPPRGARLLPLFLALIGVCFLYSALSFGVRWLLWDSVLMSAMVLAGGYALREMGFGGRNALALIAPVLAFVWAEEGVGGFVLLVGRHAVAIVFEAVLGVALVRAASRATRVSMDLVLGTACTYLLIGLGYSHLFVVLDLLDPDGIRGAGARDPLAEFTYYSFGSLTTLGTGDIVPVDPFARALTVGEAVAGNLYLAIALARVVSLHVAHQTSKP